MKQRITHLILLLALCTSAQAQYPITKRFVRPIFDGQLFMRLDSLNRWKITPKTGSEQAVKIDSSNVINLGPKLAQLKQIATVNGDTTTLPASGSVYLRQIGHSIGTIGATGKFNHIAPSLSALSDFSDCFSPSAVYDGSVWQQVTGVTSSTTPGYGALLTASTNGVYYLRKVTGPIDCKWFGTLGTGDTALAARTKETLALNKCLAYSSSLNNPQAFGAYAPTKNTSNQVLIRQGVYSVNDELLVKGSMHIVMEEATSYGGVKIIQSTPGKHLFHLVKDTDGASVGVRFSGGILLQGTNSSNTDIALIYGGESSADGNNSSLYIERVTFRTPENYAIHVKRGDDVKVLNSTFDVLPVNCIRLGSATNAVTHAIISGNTFFRISNTVIDAYNTHGLVVSNNTVYDTDGNGTNPIFVNATGNTQGLVVSGNEARNLSTFAIVSSLAAGVNITGNTSFRQTGRFFYLTGGTVLQSPVIANNSVHNAGAWTVNVFDGVGSGIAGGVFSGNAITAGASTTLAAFNLTDSRTLGNEIFGNTTNSNFTTKYNVNSPISNGIFSFSTAVQGDSPTSRTSYVTTLSADTPSGFFKYNGTSGMPSDPSGFNEWMGIRIRNETSTASGGAAWITDLVVNEKTKTMYVGGNDAQANTRNSFDRIWSKSALPFQENATHSSLYMWAYNATNSQYEPTSPANIRSVVLGLGSMATQSGSGVAITGGTVSGVAITASSIPLSNVTGAGSMAAQNSTAVNASGVFSGTFTGTATTTTTGLFIPSSGQINQSAGSSVSGGNTVMTSQATGTNGTSGYAEIQTLYGGVGYTAPLVFQRQGGAVLIGTSTNDGVNKLQVNGSAVATSISATNAAVTNFTATNSTVTTETVGTLNVTGSVAMGNTSNTSTATPLTLNMGGTYSNSPGANPKLKLADIGGTVFGLGVSANQMDFTIPNGSRYNYYVNGASVMSAGAASVKTGVDISITDTTKGFVLKSPDGTCYRITVANGGTLSTASITCP